MSVPAPASLRRGLPTRLAKRFRTALLWFAALGAASCAGRVTQPPRAPGAVDFSPPGKDPVAAVINTVDDSEFKYSATERAVVQRLHAADPQFVQKLLAGVDDAARSVPDRGKVIQALGILGDDAAAAVPRLVEIAYGLRPPPLQPAEEAHYRRFHPPDRFWPLYHDAGVALIKIGAPAVPALLDMVRGGSPEQATHAIALLAQIGGDASEVVPVLLDRLAAADDPREAVQLGTALEKINRGALRSPRARAAAPRLIEATHGDDGYTATQAVLLLSQMGEPADQVVTAAVRAMARGLARDPAGGGMGDIGYFFAVARYGSAAGPILRRHAGDPRPAVRLAAAALMAAKLPGPWPFGKSVAGRREVELLARLLRDDPDADVRQTAADALGVIGAKARAAVPALERAAADDPSKGVRGDAHNALRRVRAK